jgi:hypothetical protein
MGIVSRDATSRPTGLGVSHLIKRHPLSWAAVMTRSPRQRHGCQNRRMTKPWMIDERRATPAVGFAVLSRSAQEP